MTLDTFSKKFDTFADTSNAVTKMLATPAGVRDALDRPSGGVASLNHRLHAFVPPG